MPDNTTSHTAPSQLGGLPPLQPGAGFEIGRFRLKPDVQESDMIAAYNQMVREALATQPGWIFQRLIRLDDGLFYDLSFAANREAS